jgi:hypothetical protein
LFNMRQIHDDDDYEQGHLQLDLAGRSLMFKNLLNFFDAALSDMCPDNAPAVLRTFDFEPKDSDEVGPVCPARRDRAQPAEGEPSVATMRRDIRLMSAEVCHLRASRFLCELRHLSSNAAMTGSVESRTSRP